MADEPKGALDAPADGSAKASGTAGDANADAGGAEETVEQKVARLEAEKKASDERAENANKLALSYKSSAEELNRIKEAQAASPSPTGAAADPFAQFMNQYDQQIRAAEALAAQYPDNADLQLQITNARVGRAMLISQKQQADQQAALSRAKPVFEKDAELGNRAEQLYREGRAATPEDALLMARGEAAANPEDRRRVAADAAAADALKAKPSTAAGGSSSPAANGKATIKFAEYVRRVNGGDWKLIQQVRNGQLVIDTA